MSSAEARKVRDKRPESCFTKDQRYSSGERWLWDYSPPIEEGVRRLHSFVIFVCRRSFFIRIYPVWDKSAQTFITTALEPLRVFVRTSLPDTRTSLPDTRLLSIWGDSDSAVSQWGHGEDQDTRAIKAYNAILAHPILIVRLPAKRARDERSRAAGKADEDTVSIFLMRDRDVSDISRWVASPGSQSGCTWRFPRRS